MSIRSACVVLGIAAAMFGCGPSSQAESQRPAQSAQNSGVIYECPMRCVKPGERAPHTQTTPGDCPVCGMELVPRAPGPAKNSAH